MVESEVSRLFVRLTLYSPLVHTLVNIRLITLDDKSIATHKASKNIFGHQITLVINTGLSIAPFKIPMLGTVFPLYPRVLRAKH